MFRLVYFRFFFRWDGGRSSDKWEEKWVRGKDRGLRGVLVLVRIDGGVE